MMKVRFLLTKLDVPTLPETAQSMPLHWRLKLLWIYFKRSRALISCYGLFGGCEDSLADEAVYAADVPPV
jgi:hypothetical protein